MSLTIRSAREWLEGVLSNTNDSDRDVTISFNPPPEERDSDSYHLSWIDDEHLLREEGAIYGLAGIGLEEKQEVIQNYFQYQIAGFKGHLDTSEEVLGALENDKNILLEGLKNTTLRQVEIEKMLAPERHNFTRRLIGVIIYFTILLFSFFGVYDWIQPVWREFTFPISLAVFFLGAFSLIGLKSTIYELNESVASEENREHWKIFAEEYGLPIVSTIFILINGLESQPIHINLGFSLLLLCIFLFAGKGFLVGFVRMQDDRRIRIRNHRKHEMLIQERENLEEEKRNNDQELSMINQRILDVKYVRAKLQKRIEQLELEAKTKRNYFASEFALAHQMSQDRSVLG